MSEYVIPPESLDELAKKFGLGDYASLKSASFSSGVQATSRLSIRKDGGDFVFTGLKYDGVNLGEVKLLKDLLD